MYTVANLQRKLCGIFFIGLGPGLFRLNTHPLVATLSDALVGFLCDGFFFATDFRQRVDKPSQPFVDRTLDNTVTNIF